LTVTVLVPVNGTDAIVLSTPGPDRKAGDSGLPGDGAGRGEKRVA